MKIRTRLVWAFVGCGLTPLVFVSAFSFLSGKRLSEGLLTEAKATLNERALDHLIAMRDLRKQQLERHFADCKDDMQLLVSTMDSARREVHSRLARECQERAALLEQFFADRKRMTAELAESDPPFVQFAARDLSEEFQNVGNDVRQQFKGRGNGEFDAPESYVKAHEKYYETFKYLREKGGYADTLLLDATHGDVIFTTEKGADFGVRIGDIDCSLRDAWQAAVKGEQIVVSDVRTYPPLGGIPAQFVAGPVKSDGQLIGVVAIRLGPASISELLARPARVGVTADAFLVGPDQLLRSDSLVEPTAFNVAASLGDPSKGAVNVPVDRLAAAAGGQETVRVSFRSAPTLAWCLPLQVGQSTWTLVCEQEMREAIVGVAGSASGADAATSRKLHGTVSGRTWLSKCVVDQSRRPMCVFHDAGRQWSARPAQRSLAGKQPREPD